MADEILVVDQAECILETPTGSAHLVIVGSVAGEALADALYTEAQAVAEVVHQLGIARHPA